MSPKCTGGDPHRTNTKLAPDTTSVAQMHNQSRHTAGIILKQVHMFKTLNQAP